MKKELDTVIPTLRIYSQSTGIEFNIEKCAMLSKKRVKSKITKRIILTNEKSIRTLEEKENYKYLGILKVDTIK